MFGLESALKKEIVSIDVVVEASSAFVNGSENGRVAYVQIMVLKVPGNASTVKSVLEGIASELEARRVPGRIVKYELSSASGLMTVRININDSMRYSRERLIDSLDEQERSVYSEVGYYV